MLIYINKLNLIVILLYILNYIEIWQKQKAIKQCLVLHSHSGNRFQLLYKTENPYNKRKRLLYKFTGHSSDRWQLRTHPSYMVLWDHLLGAHTQILPQLDSTYLERKVCSSMIWDNKPLHFHSNIDCKVAFGTSTAFEGANLFAATDVFLMPGKQKPSVVLWVETWEEKVRKDLWIRCCKFLNSKCFRTWMTHKGHIVLPWRTFSLVPLEINRCVISNHRNKMI